MAGLERAVPAPVEKAVGALEKATAGWRRGGERRRRAAALWRGGEEGWRPAERGGESHVGARHGGAGTAMRSRCGRTCGMGVSAAGNQEERKSKSGILFFSNAVRAMAHRRQLPTDSYRTLRPSSSDHIIILCHEWELLSLLSNRPIYGADNR
jgi:hypothetical protein